MIWEDLGTFSITPEWQFSPNFESDLVRITHLSVPLKQDYVKAALAHGFQDDLIISVFNPRRLTCRQEKEIFSFPSLDQIPKSLAFKRLDTNIDITWKIKLEYKNMIIPSNKTQSTTAQALPDSIVVNAKKSIIPEKADGSRRNYLISNLGAQTVYFKYLPIGADPTASTFVVSQSDYDFLLLAGEKWFDTALSQNAVYAIANNASPATKVKAIEYNYL